MEELTINTTYTIYLEDLSSVECFYPNLKKISLSRFIIKANNYENLNTLNLCGCVFESRTIHLPDNVKNITILECKRKYGVKFIFPRCLDFFYIDSTVYYTGEIEHVKIYRSEDYCTEKIKKLILLFQKMHIVMVVIGAE